MVDYGVVRKLAKAFNISESYVSRALRYDRDGDRAKKIRHVALTQYDGLEMESIKREK